MSRTSFFYSDTYNVGLPEAHRFPMEKYRMLRESLLKRGVLTPAQLIEATPINQDLLLLAHEEDYVRDVLNLTLEKRRAKRIGLPLTKEMVLRAMVSLGGSVAASNKALEVGISGALSSGTHHALSDNGEGFCFFNDFAVISRMNRDKSVLIVDLDVHQGNGNGQILANDSHVTIVDIFCKNNYPLKKQCEAAGFFIGLDSGTDDDTYLETLESTLSRLDQKYDLLLYQAGVDVLKGDRFGNFHLSLEGIAKRDSLVFNWAKDNVGATSFVIGGGYSKEIERTVEANFQTFRIAKEIYGL